MNLSVRPVPQVEQPGLRGVARVDRRTDALIARLRPGDVAVLDHLDLDRVTAAALVNRGVSAVVNAAPMISGRFPNLGPLHLLESGLVLIDSVGVAGLEAIGDGVPVWLSDNAIYVRDQPVASGRRVDAALVSEEMARARNGMTVQLDSFVRNSVEFLRREEDLLVHGLGVPTLRTTLAGRPVVVVVDAPGCRRDFAKIVGFVKEQRAVLIGVGRGADILVDVGWRPDVVVIDAGSGEMDTPSVVALRKARDVVVRVERGSGPAAVERVARLGLRPLRFAAGVSPEDAAFLIGHAGDASLLVGVGRHTSLEEFLERSRPGLASGYLTRLKVGPRLVDATMIPLLYTGVVRRRHLWSAIVVGLIAVAAAVAATPIGQGWFGDLWSVLRGFDWGRFR
jgi:uncharacterized membrane-anchored protein